MRLLADNGWNHNAIAEMLDMSLQQVKSHACYKKIKIKRPPAKKQKKGAKSINHCHDIRKGNKNQ